MPVSIRDDYAPGTRNGNTCSCCSAGRRDVRDAAGARKELIVDLGVSIDFEGYLMICESCVREAAALLGMADPTEADALRARLDQVNAEAAELRTELSEAHQLVALMREYDAHRDVASPSAPAMSALGVPEPASWDDAHDVAVEDEITSYGDLVLSDAPTVGRITGIGSVTSESHADHYDAAGIEAAKLLHPSSFVGSDEDPDPGARPRAAAEPEPLPAAHDDGAPAFQYRRGPGRPRTAR